MNRQMQSLLVPFLSVGFVSGVPLAAAAQEVVEERYTVERVAPNPDAAAYEERIIERRVVEDPAIDDDDDADNVGAVAPGLPVDVAMARCAAQYRSFDPATGTYLSYAGEARPCPYLP